MTFQSIIVPKISTVPVHEPRARAILRSKIWKGAGKPAPEIPTGGQLLEAHTKGMVDAVDYDTVRAAEIGKVLY